MRVAGAAAVVACLTAGALEAQTTWWVDLAAERASVTTSVETTWETARAGLGLTSPGWGGCSVFGERQERGGLVDASGSALCYRRLGAWTIAAGGSATPDAEFLPKLGGEAYLSRILAGTMVGSIGYRVLDYPGTMVHQAQPALTWYHRRGEVEARGFVTYNESRARTSRTGLFRMLHDFSSRVRVGGGFSYGDRIFDIASLVEGDQRAWQGFGYLRLGFTANDYITVGGTVAHERPAFDLLGVNVGYRRTF